MPIPYGSNSEPWYSKNQRERKKKQYSNHASNIVISNDSRMCDLVVIDAQDNFRYIIQLMK
jgi:hypothetical protein